MINYVNGDMLAQRVDALVNTVNTVGVMGKGIALQFKRAFPDNFTAYERAAKSGKVQLGKVFVYEWNKLSQPRFIINFPTKSHWKSASRLEDIESGLADLTIVVQRLPIHSIALPALGCGNGGLKWTDVQPLIESAARSLPEVIFLVYPPQETQRLPNRDRLDSHATN